MASHRTPLPEILWTQEAQRHLRSLMEQRGVSFAKLAHELTLAGTEISGPELEELFRESEIPIGLYFQILAVFGEDRVEIAQVEPYDG